MADTATKLPVTNDTASKVETQAPARWTPFEALRRDFDRAFDHLGPWRLAARPALFDLDLSWPAESALLSPAVDVSEKAGEYEITAELPGLDDKDIEVKLSKDTLTLKGEKKEDKEEQKKGYHLSERRYGSFTRSFRLPDGVDAEKIAAKFSKGVLTITVPKTANAGKSEKTIPVNAAA